MKEKQKDAIEQKGWKKWFQRDNLIILILSGVLLLIIALPTGSSGKSSTKPKEQSSLEVLGEAKKEQILTSAQGETAADSLTEYEQSLEKKLEEILEGMSGAGKVKVMITFASTQELVVEKDYTSVASSTNENDGSGGTREVYQTENGETTIYTAGDGSGGPYVIKTLMPKVEGVLVAAQGAGTGEVTKNIAEAVQALFDIEAHKIKVIRMKVSG